MTIRELIEQLEDIAGEFGDNAEVRLAVQPNWPFEHSISGLGEANGVVYIAEGQQLGYLPGAVTEQVWQ